MTNDIPPDSPGCEATADSDCIRQVLALGNPILWWAAAVALIVSLWQWVVRRDWRFAVPVIGVAALWLPWFRYDDRPIFLFYAVAFLPFSCAALAMACGLLLGHPDAPGGRRMIGAAVVLTLVATVIVCFTFFWPIWTHGLVTHDEWSRRIWFDGWI